MSKSDSVQCILLVQKGDVKQVKLTLNNGTLSLDGVKQFLKKKETPQVLGKFPYKDQTFTLFGFSTGKAGTENKHELPPPLDTKLYFGDILVIACKNSDDYRQAIPLTLTTFENFYNAAFGGFEDLDEDEEEEEEEEEEVVEEEEEEEEEEEVEEEEEEEEEVVEEEVEDYEEERPQPSTKAKKPSKKKKTNQAALSNNISHVLMNIPIDQHLKQDTSLKQPSDAQRLRGIKTLENLLEQHSVKGLNAIHLESLVYNACIQEAHKKNITPHWDCKTFQYLYTMKLRTLAGNILPDCYVQNEYLLPELEANSITISNLKDMSPYQMNNTLWKDYIHRRQQREKRQLEGNKAMATDQFLCKGCWKRECTYYEMQTRSADEPMTIFITCMNCGKHWRQ